MNTTTPSKVHNKMSTQEMAAYMLESGVHYTAASLSKELGIRGLKKGQRLWSQILSGCWS